MKDCSKQYSGFKPADSWVRVYFSGAEEIVLIPFRHKVL